MTSPSIRRQREYDRQQPIPQPNFGILVAAGPGVRVNWQESLQQGFQSRHAQQLQSCGAQHQQQNVVMSMTVEPSNWQFQASHAQQLQNHGSLPQQLQNHDN
jgi:hypothetical protein